MGLPLPSLLENKNSSHLKVFPTNPSVVCSADEPRKNRIIVQAATRTATTDDKSFNSDLTLRTYIGPKLCSLCMSSDRLLTRSIDKMIDTVNSDNGSLENSVPPVEPHIYPRVFR